MRNLDFGRVDVRQGEDVEALKAIHRAELRLRHQDILELTLQVAGVHSQQSACS